MEVIVRTTAGLLSLDADVLDVARLVASVRGFHLDIEPQAHGAKLTATHHRTGAIVRANGGSAKLAAENLINLLTDS